MDRLKVAVLISGRGSNLQSLLKAARAPDYPAQLVQVVSNEATAPGLAHAEAANVPTEVVDHRDFKSRPGFEAALNATLTAAAADLVVLAGFMRVLTPDLVDAWRDRMINVHPSLLPAFPGSSAVRDALAAGVKITGTTIHYVREAVDDGPIVAQAAVPILNGDDVNTLGTRIRSVEHGLLPACVARIARGETGILGKWVQSQDEPGPDACLANPPVL
jgi:phosphoribosylglycinamide formyltransferase-1